MVDNRGDHIVTTLLEKVLIRLFVRTDHRTSTEPPAPERKLLRYLWRPHLQMTPIPRVISPHRGHIIIARRCLIVAVRRLRQQKLLVLLHL